MLHRHQSTTTQRDLNAIRQRTSEQKITTTPASASGITVETASTTKSDIESSIGMSVDVLRCLVLFQRGGLECSLLLRLQEVTGLNLVSEKDFTTAFNNRLKVIKSYAADYPYNNE